MKLTWLGVLGVLLAACASSTVIMVGKSHPAISADAVSLYITPPAHYEVVAIIQAKSKGGWTDQAKLDHAMDELKSRAAEMGANGILLQGQGESANGAVAVPVGNGLYVAGASNQQAVSAQAIYVTP